MSLHENIQSWFSNASSFSSFSFISPLLTTILRIYVCTSHFDSQYTILQTGETNEDNYTVAKMDTAKGEQGSFKHALQYTHDQYNRTAT